MSNTEDFEDPLERLSAYEKKLILAMVPSRSERYRMNNPKLTKVERENLLITIIRERRRLYERNFKQSCKNSGLEPPAVRNVMSEERERPYRPHMHAALSETQDERIRENKLIVSHSYAIENQRREKNNLPQLTEEEDERQKQLRRKRRRGLRL